MAALTNQPKLDLSNEEVKDSLRFRDVVPVDNVVPIDGRTLFGVFHASYWGHAFENSDRGIIPAESISLRPFHFLLYLSESGRIYLASQYLGQFGGYTGLQRTITSLLPAPENIRPHSFRLSSSYYKGAQAKEVKVTVSKKGSSIISANVFKQSAIVAFKKGGRDDGFETEVSKRLLSVIGRPVDEVKRAVASILNENELMDVTEDDIADCTVVATIEGNRKVIHMLESGMFATRFPLNVELKLDGHPKYEDTKREILRVLRNEVISRKEDV